MLEEMQMSDCKHVPHQIGRDRPYFGSVATPPYTDENPAAAGNISYTEECTVCGAQRRVNQNQSHYEYSAWGPDRKTRELFESERLELDRIAYESRCRNLAQKYGVEVLSTNRDGSVNIKVRGELHCLTIAQIQQAATQPQAEDLLAEVYTGMLVMAQEKLAARE
jgi:hypothetical protein